MFTVDRRSFLEQFGMGSLGAMLAVDLAAQVQAAEPPKAEPVSDRKIRLGIVGYGVCRMARPSAFRTIRTSRWSP